VPFASDPDFVDRPEILAWATLVGLSGVGYVDVSSAHIVVLTDNSKLQPALQYAHSIRNTSLQTFVFWVHASTCAWFKEAY
jgi:hypothetical protein